MRSKGRLPLLSVLLTVLLCSWPVLGQEQGGSIQGIVKDSSGGVLPGVTVEVRSPALVGVSTTVTDAQGVYRFPALPPGIYVATATLQGFSQSKAENVVLGVGQLLKVDLTLSLAGVAETVQVTGTAPLIDTKQNASFATIQKDVIDKIPKARDFTSVVTTASGANNESRNAGIQIDGASGSENRFVVDGMDATELRGGTSGKTVLVDFIQEVQVKLSGYNAEFGGSLGGVISAITKSGSNKLRGSAGGYVTSNKFYGPVRDFWQINPFDNVTAEDVTTPDDSWRYLNPILEVGGPVLKDRLWFYLGYAFTRNDYGRTATFSNSPAPYTTKSFSWSDQTHVLIYNLTTQLGPNVRVRFAGQNQRYRTRGSAPALQPDGSKFLNGTPTNGFTTAAWDSDPAKFDSRWNLIGNDQPNDLYSGNLDWIITPHLFLNVSSGRFVYDTITPPEFAGDQIVHSFNTSNLGVAGIPANLQFPAGYADNKSTNQTVHDRYGRVFINANGTWFKSLAGQHTVKTGVRFERLTNEVNSGNQQPTITLYWGITRNTFDGRAVRGTYGYYGVSRGIVNSGNVASNNLSFWLQDSWTVTDKLTINAGVRAENEHVPSYRPENPGIDFAFRDKIAPRIGFAYDVKGDSQWKVYGSFGKFFDITKLDMPRTSLGASHWIQYFYTLDTYDWQSINCQEGNTGCPGTFIEQADGRHPANAIDPLVTAYFGKPMNLVDPAMKPVQSGEVTLGVDHELNATMSIGLRYVHKWLDRTVDDVGQLVPGVGEVFFITNPGFGLGLQVLPPPAPPSPPAVRDYDGVELRLRKRLAQNWSLNASYLWSRLRGNYGGLASSDENGRTATNNNRYFDGLYQSFDDNGEVVMGPLMTDRPHQLKAQMTYDLPWGTTLGLNAIVQSGTPFNSQLSWKGYPVYYADRGDMGRTPVYSQFDLLIQHDIRLRGNQRINLNVNVDNLFDQKAVTNINYIRWRDWFNQSDAYFFAGFDPSQLADQMRAQGQTQRDDPRYGLPAGYQNRRAIRFGVKYLF